MRRMITLLAIGLAVGAQGAGKGNDPYGLMVLRDEVAMRSSSSAEDWANSNGDARGIAPGETLVLADLEGPGVIRHIWNTVSSKEYGASRLLRLQIWWDGEKEPSVDCPLGDFFGMGHGVNGNYESEIARVSAEGLARNCYWSMPFRKSAKITITNEGTKPAIAFYWYVDWAKVDSLPEETPYFHAMYRQEYPCVQGPRYLIADIEGRGHYVGTLLNCRQHERGWMGEGDDFFFIDGEEEPSLKGTGTEDYFCDAWGFRESSGPYYGVNIYEGYEIQDRTTVYRWHLHDPVSFRNTLRMEIEHWGWWWVRDEEGNATDEITAGERADDWSSVAFWYQLEPHKIFPEMTVGMDRLYYDWSKIIEAETLIEETTVTAGDVIQGGGAGYSEHATMLWSCASEGQTIEIPVTVEEDGKYSIVLSMIRQPYNGKFVFEVDGKRIGKPIDLYSADLSTREYALENLQLDAGKHVVKAINVGKHYRATGYSFGMDGLLMLPVE